jgi:hypothetical protein
MQTTNYRKRASILGIGLICVALRYCSGEANAQEITFVQPPACKYDLWIIDTHCVDDCDCDASKARYYRLGDDCQWVSETEDTFLSTLDPAKTANFMLPGYGTGTKWAVQHLWDFHHKIEEQAKCRGMDCAPTRIVMLEWPSAIEKVRVPKDAREKARRAEIEGYWLAQLLAKFPKDYRVNLVAYSFGARIATSTAHHLAGGRHCNCPTVYSPHSPRLTGTLMASAVDADWLGDCQPHGLARDRFEKLLLMNNRSDLILKTYFVLNRAKRPKALGAVGLLLPDAAYAPHIQQWEVSQMIGRGHNWHKYIDTPEIMSLIAKYAFYLE